MTGRKFKLVKNEARISELHVYIHTTENTASNMYM